jgi:hypothetical protein
MSPRPAGSTKIEVWSRSVPPLDRLPSVFRRVHDTCVSVDHRRGEGGQTCVVTADDDDDVVWELETPIDEHLLLWDPDEEDEEDLPAPVRTRRRRQRQPRRRRPMPRPRVLAGVIALLVLVLVGVAVAGRGSDDDADIQDVASAEKDDDDTGFTARSTTTRDAATTSTTAVEETTTTAVPEAAPVSSIVPAGATPAAVGPAGGPGGDGGATTVPPTTVPSDPADEPLVEGTHVTTGVSPGTVAAGEAVEVRWRQSSASGITFATFLIQHDATGNHLPSSAACPQGNDTPRWAGTAHDASFVASCRTPAGAASGRYTVSAHLEHADGSTSRPVIGSLEITGGPADTSPPVLVSSSVSPTSGPSGTIVTLRWRFASPPGMHFSTFFLRTGDEHVTGGPDCATGSEVPMRSGTVHDATYRATCDTAGIAPGTYEVEVYAQDQAGNVLVAPAGTLTVTAP